MVESVTERTSKLLIGMEAIMKYLRISRPLFKRFIKNGMPVLFFGARWYAHKDNLDDYFKKITRVDSRMVEIDD